jgi:hypothetical protein
MMQGDVTKSFGEGKPIPIGAMTKKMKVHLHQPRLHKPIVTGEEN